MTPVKQTKFGTEGNCFNACIASLLDLKIDQVPELQGWEDEQWITELNEWLINRGQVYFELRIAKTESTLFFRNKDFYHVLIGQSPRLDGYDHCVVGRKGIIIHDPHPDNIGIVDNDSYIKIGIIASTCIK
jgi:hypothetical protein